MTTSGTIVTLLFGLVALLTKDAKFVLPDAAEAPLLAALILFTTAAIVGVLVNAPLDYGNVKISDEQFKKWWGQPAETSEIRIAATKLKAFRKAQQRNGLKSWVLVAALACEVLAVASLAVTVVVILNAA